MRHDLVQLREDATLSRKQLAKALDTTVRSISRYEDGSRAPEMEIRRDYAAALGCSVAKLNAAIRNDQAPNGHKVRRSFRLFASLEQGATALYTWQPISLPGLLQTEAYAREVERAWPLGAPPLDIERRVTHRLARQRVLDHLSLFALMDRSVLSRATGGPAVMAEQLDHLRTLAERPNVHIRVVPLDTTAHPAGTGSFTLFVGEDGDEPYMVATENLSGPSYHEDPTIVAAYESLFSHLWKESDELGSVELQQF